MKSINVIEINQNINNILNLLKAPKSDYDRITYILPYEVKSLGISFIDWLYTRFTSRPGFLLDLQWSATVLGIKEESFEKVAYLFEKARYKGYANEKLPKLWWQSKLKIILFDILFDDSEILPWKLGYKLKGLTVDDIQICAVCGQQFPEIVAFTKEVIKKPMHLKCTVLHEGYESLLYFEEIRRQL